MWETPATTCAMMLLASSSVNFPSLEILLIIDKTKLDQKTQRLLSREITSMERLHHPNIIRLYEVVETLAKMHDRSVVFFGFLNQ
jgi:serine/threonine protein kinase